MVEESGPDGQRDVGGEPEIQLIVGEVGKWPLGPIARQVRRRTLERAMRIAHLGPSFPEQVQHSHVEKESACQQCNPSAEMQEDSVGNPQPISYRINHGGITPKEFCLR